VENLWISAVMSSHPTIGDYRRWDHNSARDVDWVIGACMLVRAEVIRDVGGFDERFFMYAEESDWQKRIRGAGWTIRLTPTAEVVHLGGASGEGEKARINRHVFESLDYYERKHHGIVGFIALRLAMIIGSALRIIGWSGVYILRPKRRAAAAAKVRLLSWLFVRQGTYWRIPG
jgi:GT2 family glycosyltransferase